MFGETSVPPVNDVGFCDPFATSLAECVLDRFDDGSSNCAETQSALGIACQSKYESRDNYTNIATIPIYVRLYNSL